MNRRETSHKGKSLKKISQSDIGERENDFLPRSEEELIHRPAICERRENERPINGSWILLTQLSVRKNERSAMGRVDRTKTVGIPSSA